MKKKLLLALLSAALLCMAMGCGFKSEDSNSAATEADAGNGDDKVTEDQIIKVDDILSTTDWIGKTKKELNLDVDEKETHVRIEGDFLGSPADGNISFHDKNSEGDSVAKWVSFTIKKKSIVDFFEKLMDLYGGPVNEGMEPYAKDNGGAVEWFEFDAGKAIVRIQQGSEQNYVTVTINSNPNPTNAEMLVLKTPSDSEISTLPLEMMMKVTGYEDGILTVAITNQVGEEMTYTDDYILAKSYDNGVTYAHMNKSGVIGINVSKANVYKIADLETQELKCDLRIFGKLEAGMYMIILDDMKAEFQLVPGRQ